MFHWLKQEYHDYLRLSEPARKLFITILLYHAVYPLLNLFANAFIWQSEGDPFQVAAYNIGIFLVIPITFYETGVLMRRLSLQSLYWFGLVGQGVATALLFFLPHLSTWQLFIIGIFQGIPFGCYWANRNFITQASTTNKDRVYFTGLEMSVWRIADVVAPLLFGWSIALGELSGWYASKTAYQCLIIAVLIILGLAGWVFRDANISPPNLRQLMLSRSTPEWNIIRLQQILYGLSSGVGFFFPTLIVSVLIGKEGALGTVQSLGAVATAIVTYLIGKKIQSRHRFLVMCLGFFIWLVGVLFLLFNFHAPGGVLYLFALMIGETLLWTGIKPLSMQILDQSAAELRASHYAFLIDYEIFLAIGRVSGVLIFLGLFVQTTIQTSIQLTPLIVIIAIAGLIGLTTRVHHR